VLQSTDDLDPYQVTFPSVFHTVQVYYFIGSGSTEWLPCPVSDSLHEHFLDGTFGICVIL
jgi:hypothetical protein